MKGRALQKLCCVLRICEEDPSRIWQFIKRPATAQHFGGKSKKKVRKKKKKKKKKEELARIWQFIKRPATAQHLGGKRKKITRFENLALHHY